MGLGSSGSSTKPARGLVGVLSLGSVGGGGATGKKAAEGSRSRRARFEEYSKGLLGAEGCEETSAVETGAVFVAATIALWRNPEEAMHFVQYAGLGLLLHRALSYRIGDSSIYVVGVLIGTTIGCLDETEQADELRGASLSVWGWAELALDEKARGAAIAEASSLARAAVERSREEIDRMLATSRASTAIADAGRSGWS